MTDAQTRIEDMKEWVHEHRREILCVVAGIAAAILIIGLTLTWFVSDRGHSTVGKVQDPATLKILGPNETATEQIDLTYDADKDELSSDGKQVTRKRAFCVQSNEHGFELQIANTTNIKGLQINVSRVNTVESADQADVAGLDGLNHHYAWAKRGNALDFTFLNPLSDADHSVAKSLSTGDPTFGDYIQDVQKNARPLYRYKNFSAEELDIVGGHVASATNFIIECTWPTEQNKKETDVVYLIARSGSSAQ